MALIVMSILMMISGMQRVEKIDSFSPKFEDYIEKGYIKSIKLLPNKIKGDFSQVWLAERGDGARSSFELNYDPDMLPKDFLVTMRQKGIEVGWADQDIWLPLLWNLLPILLLVGIVYFVFIRNRNAIKLS